MPRTTAILAGLLILAAAACRGGQDDGGTSTVVTRPTTSTSMRPTTTTTLTPPSTTVPSTTTTAPALDPLQGLSRETLATGLDRPTAVVTPPGGPRVFVAEAVGRIRIIDPVEGLLAEPFLNIRNKVGSSSIEQGLLGLAFHPSDAGRFFVYYTDRSGDSVVAEYRVGDDPDRADETTERVVLTIDQPDERHNAGMLEFGPDGFLYIGTGDGGAGGASVNGQNPATLLAAILRIDVDASDPYAIPPDNPFADGVGGAPEVWAYGLRNPWRFSIDPVGGLLYVGDVGQEEREEINVVALRPDGYNFGWPAVEGTRCFLDRACRPEDFVLPAIEYDHDEGLSVTGGHVYRGGAIPELVGHYFYADWVREWIRSFRFEAGEAVDRRDWTTDLAPGQINAFGLDGDGELLIVTWDGLVARIVPVR